MATKHLVLVHFLSPFLLLLLISSHLSFNRYSSCLALRFTNERTEFDWEGLVDDLVSKHQLAAMKGSFDDSDESDDYLALDRATRKPKKLTQRTETTTLPTENPSPRGKNEPIAEPWAVDSAMSRAARLRSDSNTNEIEKKQKRNDVLFLVVVGTSSLVGVAGLVAAAIFWYKIHKRAQATLESDYPSYGMTGPSGGSKMSPSTSINDRKLAHSAQMFHYQQQRQQIMAQEKTQSDSKPDHSEDSDDEGHTAGDYTVYECPGLAPTGEMEVRNPLFAEPDTSLTSPTTNNHYPQPITTMSSSPPPQEKSLS